MDWRSGLVLCMVLSISLLRSAGAVPHQDGPGVSVTFVEMDTVEVITTADPGHLDADLRLQPSRR